MDVKIENLTIQFGALTAVNDLSFTVHSGELLCLLGPSGCGKSTVLNAIAGFVTPRQGHIYFDDQDIAGISVEKRNLGMVFQNYSLYPHMNFYENIAFPLQVQKLPKAEIKRRVAEMAETTKITDILKRKPGQISGGQQQRVAISRALIKKPPLLLMDEPLSNLDARLRMEMREEIRRIQQDTKITTIFVTHDQEEATSISDQIILLKQGVLQQGGKPYELYVRPSNVFAANFLGTPPINLLQATYRQGKLLLAQGRLALPAQGYTEGGCYIVGIRCEDIRLCHPEQAAAVLQVDFRELLGKEALVYGKIGGETIRFLVPHDEAQGLEEQVPVSIRLQNVSVFDAHSQLRLGGVG